MSRNLGGLAAVAVLAAASQAHALTITPFFDASITSRADAAAIESAIDQVDSFYRAFTDPVQVKIVYRLADIGGGGESLTTAYRYSYADYTAMLTSDAAANPDNAVLATALANLKWGNDPANTGRPNVSPTSAGGRALGDATAVGRYGSNGVFGDGNYDGVITLDSTPGAYSWTDAVGANQESGISVLFHETDEVLGVGGGGSTLGGPRIHALGPDDLYRYAAYHTPSFTTAFSWSPATDPYFSIDGGLTRIRSFNQTNFGGDYADWARYSCSDAVKSVQDWAGCLGEPTIHLNAHSPEVIELQAIGYDGAVPEPGAWALMLAGFAALGAALRLRHYQTAM